MDEAVDPGVIGGTLEARNQFDGISPSSAGALLNTLSSGKKK